MSSSSYGLIGGLAGAAIGSTFGPTGASYGWLIGSSLGGYYAYTQQPDTRIEGPRLDDLKVQISSYGTTIPYLRGAMRIPGNVIDATDLVPHTTETTQEAEGKGGGGPSQITTTTTYTVSIDIGLCCNQILGILKVWANKKLIYDSNAGLQAACISQMRVYSGSETQSPDSLFAALHGSVPAYRGLAHVVFEDFDVTEFGNRAPQFEFLVVSDGTVGFGSLLTAGAGGGIAARDAETGYIWSSYQNGTTGAMHVVVTNWNTASVVTSLTNSGTSPSDGAIGMCYATQSREIWIPRENGGPGIVIFSGSGLVQVATIDDGNGWYGLLRYDPYHDHVWRCRTNISDTVITYNAGAHTMGNPGTIVSTGGFGISEVVFLNDGITAAILTYAQVVFVNTVTFAHITSINHGGTAIPAAGGGKMAYDSSRNRLILTGVNVGNNVVEINIAAGTATPHAVGGSPYYCVWMPTQDRYVVICGFGALTHIINPADWSTESSQTPSGYSGGVDGEYVRIPGDNGYIWHGGLSDHVTYKIPVGNIIQSTGVDLAELVQDIGELTGAAASDFDTTALAGITVDGYLLANQMTARAAMEPLQQAFYFDAVESDDVLKFVRRGGALAGTILQDDRAGAGGDLESTLEITRLAELELPQHLDVQYYDRDADYLVGSQYARRTTRYSKNVSGITFAIAMTATKAAECALVNLYTAWLRQTYVWSTTRKYAKYEPTDVVALPDAAATYYARITSKRDMPDGRIEWEAVMEDSAVYSQTGTAGAAGYVPQTVNIPPNTILRLMDINLIRDQDDANGFYAAATGVEPWTGAQLLRSIDNGQTYQALTSFTAPAAIGTAISVLDDWTGGNDFEYANSVDVLLVRGSLANATETEVLGGANACVIGNEILQFTTATLVGSDTYRLSGLLRGRRGTEWAQSTHAVGDTFVLTDIATWRNIWQDTVSIGREYKYRAPTFGQTLPQAAVYTFANNAARLKPYAPSHVEGVRNTSNDLTITWNRRTRIDGQWRDNVDVPLGEASELYDVEIYDAGFSTLKRTFGNATVQSQAYSAAEQTTDGITPGDAVGVKVYQRSAVVGRGYAAQGIL